MTLAALFAIATFICLVVFDSMIPASVFLGLTVGAVLLHAYRVHRMQK